jgi:Domain of unknown function (DUF4382)
MRPFQNYFKALPWLMALLFAVLVGGCGGGGGSATAPAAPGTLGVSLTDSPACGFDEVNVTVRKVRVHQSSTSSDTDAGWADITLNPPRKINLLNLTNGVLDYLGETPLAAGHYTQLRLVLDPNNGRGLANSIVLTGGDGSEISLDTPSAVQSGIKLVNEFDVPSGQRVDLLLDFDACKSIVLRGDGTYALKPVIKVVPFELNGINGYVDTALLGSNVMVTAQQNGNVVQATAPKPLTGEFLLSRLPPGNYDVVFTANGRATAVIAAVPVPTTTSIVLVSTNAAPITLSASGTHKISGTVTLNPVNPTTVAYVAAKQTVGTTPTVTVKSVAADDLTGNYALTLLPIGKPKRGTLGVTLPVVFAEQDVAGKYKVEATASGYQTQLSAEKNISLIDETQNFVLMP